MVKHSTMNFQGLKMRLAIYVVKRPLMKTILPLLWLFVIDVRWTILKMNISFTISQFAQDDLIELPNVIVSMKI